MKIFLFSVTSQKILLFLKWQYVNFSELYSVILQETSNVANQLKSFPCRQRYIRKALHFKFNFEWGGHFAVFATSKLRSNEQLHF